MQSSSSLLSEEKERQFDDNIASYLEGLAGFLLIHKITVCPSAFGVWLGL